jgi:hypothetical protein
VRRCACPAAAFAATQRLAGKEYIMGRAFGHGWIGLPSEGEVYLEHGIPRQVRVVTSSVDVERMAEEVADIAGMHVTLGRWEADQETGEMEAVVHIAAEDVNEILKRLAHASAETFYDRYQKPMDASDLDFDDEAYAQDMNYALAVCGLHWGQIDDRPLKRTYLRALHREVEEMAEHARHPGTEEQT